MATLEEKGGTDLIHHSDRGVQYTSVAYTSVLYEAGIRISMTESGDLKDNAVAERLNNTIKNELFKDIKFHSIEEVRRSMDRAVEFFNNELHCYMVTYSFTRLSSYTVTLLHGYIVDDTM